MSKMLSYFVTFLISGELKFSVQWAKFSNEIQGEGLLSSGKEEMKQRFINFKHAKKQV